MSRKGFISPGLAGLSLVILFLVGAGIFMATQPSEEAAVTPVQPDGEFEQALMNSGDLESPFANLNGFDNYTVDSDASQGTANVLDQATAEWTVANGTDLGLKERRAVLYFESDGAIGDVDVEFKDQLADSSTFSSGDVELGSVEMYDYEAAVSADSLSAGEMGVQFQEVDGTSAQASLGRLEGGEYAVVPEFEFASGVSTSTTEGVVDVLSTMTVSGDTDGDVDEINSLDIQTRTK